MFYVNILTIFANMNKVFKFGFSFNGMRFGWCKRELYRLPQTYNNRFYCLKKLNEITIGNKIGYRVNRKKLTINQLEAITLSIEPIIINSNNEDLPF